MTLGHLTQDPQWSCHAWDLSPSSCPQPATRQQKEKVHVDCYCHVHYLQPSITSRSLCRSALQNVCTAEHAREPILVIVPSSCNQTRNQCKCSMTRCLCFVLVVCLQKQDTGMGSLVHPCGWVKSLQADIRNNLATCQARSHRI